MSVTRLLRTARVAVSHAIAAPVSTLVQTGRGWVEDLDRWMLPQRCPSCEAPVDPGALLCVACLTRIPRLALPLCASCLVRGQPPVGCARHRGRVVRPAWVYDERAALVIQTLKYGERPGLARATGLGDELARVAPPAPRPDLVMAVPLHPVRRRERGYNQAGVLADALSDSLGVPRLDGALERVRPTRPQARLDATGRRANVAGAFRVTRPEWIDGRHVLIVDDVITTGATLEACLMALSAAGANAVGLTLAWAQ